MVDCWKNGGGKGQHILLPIFYLIDPRDVRHPDSSSYNEAFEQLSLKHDPEIILEWKEALQEVGKIKGWHVSHSDGHGAIIDKVFTEVESHLRANYTLILDELVGIDSQVEEVVRLLNLDSASEKIIGIYGMGGLGKTTLAKAVYDKVSTKFERCCFLDNIRDSNEAKNVGDGIQIIRDRVCRHKLLIVFDYASLSKEFVQVATGLPLYIKVIGSLLFRMDKIFWEAKLMELKEIPPTKVQERLKISYNELTHIERQIFLDIACYFIGSHKIKPITMWNDCGFYPESTIRSLIQRSLVKNDDFNKFWMHDHVRDLGRAIVREENNQNPYKRSRIWSNKDAIDMLKHKGITYICSSHYLSSRLVSWC
ncbi:Disease resistance protein L6 [Linum grandiflorum]